MDEAIMIPKTMRQHQEETLQYLLASLKRMKALKSVRAKKRVVELQERITLLQRKLNKKTPSKLQHMNSMVNWKTGALRGSAQQLINAANDLKLYHSAATVKSIVDRICRTMREDYNLKKQTILAERKKTLDTQTDL